MKQSVIDKLRNMTVANGCTPEEAETARKKLDQILAARPNTRKVGGKTIRLFSVKINPGVKYYHAPTSTGEVKVTFTVSPEAYQREMERREEQLRKIFEL